MKNILAIDTSSKICSVAFLSFDEKNINIDKVKEDIVCLSKLDVKTHAKALMPTVEEILEMCDKDISDIDYFGIGVGPGSFTGIRIGMGAVKGFAFGKNVKIIETSSLEILARKINKESLINVDYIISMIDAKNDQMYMGIYKINHKIDESSLPIISLETVYEDATNMEEFLNKLPNENIYLIGDMVENNRDRILEIIKNEDIKNNNERSINILENEFQEANSIIEKFIEEIQFDFEGNILEYEKNILKYGEEILPNYMKKSQAERLKKD